MITRSKFLTRLPTDSVALERQFKLWHMIVLCQIALIAVLLLISLLQAITAEAPPAYLTTHAGRVISITSGVAPNDAN